MTPRRKMEKKTGFFARLSDQLLRLGKTLNKLDKYGIFKIMTIITFASFVVTRVLPTSPIVVVQHDIERVPSATVTMTTNATVTVTKTQTVTSYITNNSTAQSLPR